MEIDYCNYHYQSPATWYCRNCSHHYGDCCVARASALINPPRCVFCTNELFSLGAANQVEPFWNIIHKFLAYPFKPGPLILTFLLGLLAQLITPSLTGFVIGLLILVVGTRYGYAIIEHASMGKVTPPGLSILFTRDPDNLFVKQIIVFLIAGFAVGAIGMTGSVFLNLLILGFVTIAMPASILVLALEKKLSAAVNPMLLTQLMLKMGSGYLVLYVFLNILSGGPYYVFNYFSEFIPPVIFMPAYVATTAYFAFASAYMMGYALLQYQKQLGYRADLENEELVVESDTRISSQTLNEINLLLMGGRYEDAYGLIRRNAKQYPNDLALQQRLHKLMAETGRIDELKLHSSGLIEKLIVTNAMLSAAQIFLNTIKVVPDFKLDSAHSLFRLAAFFQERGQYLNALSMLIQITKQFPDYPDMEQVYLKAARLYAEKLNQPDKAQHIINHLLNTPEYGEETKREAEKISKVTSG